MKKSLYKQFNYLILSIFVIIILCTGGVYFFTFQNTLDDMKKELLVANAREVSNLINNYVENEINVLVRDENHILGVLGSKMSIETIIDSIIQTSLTKEETYVIDEFGSIQLANDQSMIRNDSYTTSYGNGQSMFALIKESKIQNEMKLFMNDSQADTIVIDSKLGKFKNIVISKIPIINWYVVLLSERHTVDSISKVAFYFVALLLLVLLSGSVLLQFIKMRFLKPLKRLENQVTRYQNNQEIEKPEGFYDDEVGLLALEIYQMQVKLQGSRQFLEKQMSIRVEEIHQLYTDLANNESRLNQLLEALPVGIIRLDSKLMPTYCNQEAFKIFGVKSIEQYQKRSLQDAYFPYDNMKMKLEVESILQQQKRIIDYQMTIATTAFKISTVLFSAYSVEYEGELYYEGILIDISKKIKYEKELFRQANYDGLTKTKTRTSFIRSVESYIKKSEKNVVEKGYFITFDFDCFKLINDTYSHLAGDMVLQKISDVVIKYIGGSGVVGRIGGDEFAVLLHPIEEDIVGYLENMRLLVAEQNMTYENRKIIITISIGYTNCSKYDTFKTLYYRSDHALYEAKEQGKNRINYHTNESVM